ncbi:hypothetical protein CW736_00850 [Nonlabens sp. MB-3u-79]|nr:hypothetical protein CW736_00850 [Nonlabens sp. MB-3u-79]
MFPLKIKYSSNYNGRKLWPFLLVKQKEYAKDFVVMNQEHIHAAQQKKLLGLLFYIRYTMDYLIQFLKVKNHHKAYRDIVLEREAFANEADLNDLNNRKLWSFLKFYSKKYVYE